MLSCAQGLGILIHSLNPLPAQVDLDELDELIDIGEEDSAGDGGGAGEHEDAPMEDCGVQTISTDADAAAAAAEVIVAGQKTLNLDVAVLLQVSTCACVCEDSCACVCEVSCLVIWLTKHRRCSSGSLKDKTVSLGRMTYWLHRLAHADCAVG